MDFPSPSDDHPRAPKFIPSECACAYAEEAGAEPPHFPCSFHVSNVPLKIDPSLPCAPSLSIHSFVHSLLYPPSPISHFPFHPSSSHISFPCPALPCRSLPLSSSYHYFTHTHTHTLIRIDRYPYTVCSSCYLYLGGSPISRLQCSLLIQVSYANFEKII